jgi:hypothetical protein
MHWYDRLTQAGGSLGAVLAYLLNIDLSSLFQVALYAFVGAVVGEAVKKSIKFYEQKNKKPDEQ